MIISSVIVVPMIIIPAIIVPTIVVPVFVIPVLISFAFVTPVPSFPFIIRAVVFVVATVTIVSVPGRISIRSCGGISLFIYYRSGCRSIGFLVFGSGLIDYRGRYRHTQDP